MEGKFSLGGASLGFGPEICPGSVLLWDELTVPLVAPCGVLADGVGGTVLFLDSSAVADGADERVWSVLEELLRQRHNPNSGVTVVTDAALWVESPIAWRRLAAALTDQPRAVVLVFGEGQHVRWRQMGGLQCVVVPHTIPAEDAGIVWIANHEQNPAVSLLDADGISDIRRFDHRIQQDRDKLVRSLEATAVRSPEQGTTIGFQNTTTFPLKFSADWLIEGPNVDVKPEILEFELPPGERFEQQFRFQVPADFPLKFAAPRFQLRTALPDGMGVSEPLTMTATPWCCMSGTIEPANVEVEIDGDPGEWAGRGYPLNHVTQIVEGIEAWQGAADLSANLFVGRTADSLLIGANLYDDALANADSESRASLTVAVVVPPGPSQTGDDASEGKPFLLKLRLQAEVGVTTVPGAPANLVANWKRREDSLSLEVRVPFEGSPGLASAKTFRLDAAASQATEDKGRVALVFSGKDPELADPSLYGTFQLNGETGAPPAE